MKKSFGDFLIRSLYANVTMAALLIAQNAGAQGFDAWSKHRNITVNTSATGANVAGNVDKFAVPVMLNASNFNFAEAKDDGADLRFSKSDGSPLPYQIESWDKAGQNAAVWVKVDVQGNNGSQYFAMHWGNAGAASESNAANVFEKANGWVSAWHLSEAASAAAGNYKDAVGTGAGIALGGEIASVEGRVGPATNLDLAKKQYIRIDDNAAYKLTSNATYSVWCKPKSHTISYQAIFTKGETGFRIHFYGSPEWPDNTDPNTKVHKNITEPCIESSGGGDFCPVEGVPQGGDQGTAWKGHDIKNGEWHHLTIQLSGGKAVAYYIDGAHAVTWNGGNFVSGSEPVCIGNNANRARQFDGVLDEARIQNVARSADWIKLDYESQKEGSKLLTQSGVYTVFRPQHIPGVLPEGKSHLGVYDLQGRLLSAFGAQRDAAPGLYFLRTLPADR